MEHEGGADDGEVTWSSPVTTPQPRRLRLCRPDLVAAYPITPQSSVVEHLAEMVHEGRLDTELVQVSPEHSAMSVVQALQPAEGESVHRHERSRTSSHV